jgi:hypothetical protein
MHGFIEAQGYFTLSQTNNHSFSIGQQFDSYLMKTIKNFFGASNKVRLVGKNLDFYVIEIYRKETLSRIYTHFTHSPLLGQKHIDFLQQKLTQDNPTGRRTVGLNAK